MVYCEICEKDFSENSIKQVIFGEGIIKVCLGCYREDMPLFEKPDIEKLRGIYNRGSVYKRLSEAAGLKDVDEHKKRISEFGKESGIVKDGYLKRIVDMTYNEKSKQAQKNEDLIDNFHWVIMRARRSKKISQKQLAEEIQEPESSIAMAERGIINSNNASLVKKLEEFLRINILRNKSAIINKDNLKKDLLEKLEKDGKLDFEMTKTLTIEDLDNVTKKKKWWQFGKRKEKKEEILDIEADNLVDNEE